eukprot:TRINITY_DN5216_c0_g1_i1.p1 TRINITY_DN5216_c0_g1~~TRINITY_DN5216_c0_g1_i1.p1  ORF type:complete len:194 (-),score=53.87 TRINITY_DN5216_c0_g1_i1:6-587(-)
MTKRPFFGDRDISPYNSVSFQPHKLQRTTTRAHASNASTPPDYVQQHYIPPSSIPHPQDTISEIRPTPLISPLDVVVGSKRNSSAAAISCDIISIPDIGDLKHKRARQRGYHRPAQEYEIVDYVPSMYNIKSDEILHRRMFWDFKNPPAEDRNKAIVLYNSKTFPKNLITNEKPRVLIEEITDEEDQDMMQIE